jgi:hypothetical protein
MMKAKSVDAATKALRKAERELLAACFADPLAMRCVTPWDRLVQKTALRLKGFNDEN